MEYVLCLKTRVEAADFFSVRFLKPWSEIASDINQDQMSMRHGYPPPFNSIVHTYIDMADWIAVKVVI